MMKKMSLLAVLLCMALTLTACVSSDIGEYYQSAQLYLGCGDYEYAAELFSQLGEYEDAAEYTLYAAALQAIEDDKYELARANLTAIHPFKSSGRYLTYLDAVAAEEAKELEKALTLYAQLGTFADAHLDAERLQKDIPEATIKQGRALMAKGEYEAARELFLSLDGYGASAALAENCTNALNKAAYNAAQELAASGDLKGAMEAFNALGNTLDAAKRAAELLAEIHAGLDKEYAAVTLATAPALMEAYAELGEDEIAKTRIAELTARFDKNLQLITMEKPAILLGSYPYAESGETHAVLWQVVKAEGTKLTLLSSAVLDASAEAQPIALTFTEAETAAMGEVTLPSMADLAGIADLTCAATPYALAQGAAAEDGAALYWLRDSLESGLHPIIGASGALTLPAEGALPGIRPMLTLDLEKFTFTSGSGTPEDPFRAQ
ncbi:MAG: hypothetical protein ACI4WX_12925 [Aristaeellaceae bacterium]